MLTPQTALSVEQCSPISIAAMIQGMNDCLVFYVLLVGKWFAFFFLFNSRCYWSNRPDYDQGTNGQPTARPPYNNNTNSGLNWNNQRRMRRSSSSRPDVRHQITPPFHGDVINIDFRIQPCNGYRFDLKIVTPRNAVLGHGEWCVLTSFFHWFRKLVKWKRWIMSRCLHYL